MNIEVRYVTRSGNTKTIAEAIAAEVGCTAQTVDSVVSGHVDMLFVGGSLYAGNIDKKLRKFLEGLDATQVKRVAVFSTAAGDKTALPIVKDILKGVDVCDRAFHCKGKFLLSNRGRPDADDCRTAAVFASELIK